MSHDEGTARDVTDTALWVAMYRAFESERRDAHFHDPYARQLAGPRGEQLTTRLSRSYAGGFIARTVAFDEMLLKLINDEGADAVLNLAAGLDTRPWRLAVPSTLQWFDVDLPGPLSYKQRALAGHPPRCKYEASTVDLRDPNARCNLFDKVGAAAKRVVVISEGLLVYLSEEQVATLGRDLAARRSFGWWISDVMAPEVRERLNKDWRSLLRNTPLIFAPPSGTAFFKPLGWKEREFRSVWEWTAKLNRRGLFDWLLGVVLFFMSPARRMQTLRMSGVVLFERTNPASEAGAS